MIGSVVPKSFDRPITPTKMVYDFCKANGICVICRIRDSEPKRTRCFRCAQYNVKHSTKSQQKRKAQRP